ncbi:hypothetical protein QQ045_023271 [Rhodiola kirilowii]
MSLGFRGVKSINLFLEGLWWDGGEGTYRWKYSSNGSFSVKSAYDVIRNYVMRTKWGVTEQSDSRSLHKYWRSIWSCRIPNKIKLFAWRLYYNSLPDVRNLWKRGVLWENTCTVCGFAEKRALHVIKDCWWPNALLRSLGMNATWPIG